MKELADWVETSDAAEEAKSSFFGNLVNTAETYLGTKDKGEIGAYLAGMGIGG